MASVTGMTAAAMEAIRDGAIVDAEVVGDELILERFDGATINAGDVRGAAGTNGATGATGATGASGPTTLLGDPVRITTTTGTMSTDGVIAGLVRNNVPVTIGHTYAFHTDFHVLFASVDVDAEWHFGLRVNGVLYEKFKVLRPIVLGTSYQHVIGTVFWDAPATLAIDDFDVFADEITNGADITPSGSSTLPRKFWIVDHGVVT